MRILILTIFLLSTITIIGCSTNTDCFTSDSIEKIKIFNENNKDYSLFLRISGLQEKEAFYELYVGVPQFDTCGQPSVPPLSTIHIDTNQGAVSKLVVEKENLNLLYIDSDKSNPSLKNVFVEIKKR